MNQNSSDTEKIIKNVKGLIKGSLIISILLLAIIALIVGNILIKINNSPYASSGAGLGMLIAFFSPAVFFLVISSVINFILCQKNVNSPGLIIVNIIFYIISGFLGSILLHFIFLLVVPQIILLFLAYYTTSKAKKYGDIEEFKTSPITTISIVLLILVFCWLFFY